MTSEELTLLAGPSPAREASPTFEPLAGPLFGPLRFPDPMPGATRIRGATRTNTTLAPLAVSLAAPSRPAAAPATLASFWAFGG